MSAMKTEVVTMDYPYTSKFQKQKNSHRSSWKWGVFVANKKLVKLLNIYF